MSARATLPPHQPRPNRRYRRLLPTALAVAAVAATGSTLGAPPAHAAGGAPRPHRAHAHGGPARAALVPRTESRADTGTPNVTGT
jgi:hypothetical protein